MRNTARLVSAVALAAYANAASAVDSDWQCSTLDGHAPPGLAQSASGFLGRAGRIYPSQLLGMVRSVSEMTYVHPAVEDWRARK